MLLLFQIYLIWLVALRKGENNGKKRKIFSLHYYHYVNSGNLTFSVRKRGVKLNKPTTSAHLSYTNYSITKAY